MRSFPTFSEVFYETLELSLDVRITLGCLQKRENTNIPFIYNTYLFSSWLFDQAMENIFTAENILRDLRQVPFYSRVIGA